ncbi:MAG: bifunctional hydroxymethylpyrimidine kinase/phosphomethylpyrimidine kinase [Dehalococcoidia bacterium]
MTTIARALTIAGSDSGGGAGIQADLKTFAAFGVYGMSALTAVTAQNTVGVFGVEELPLPFIAAQIDAVMTDIGTDAAKTGMLSSAAIVALVAEKAREHGITNLVVDPVMVAKSGDTLLAEDAQAAARDLLLPVSLVVTPNAPEASTLTGVAVESIATMREAAVILHAQGARWVVVKGGHLPIEGESIDLVYDGREFTELRSPRFPTKNTHGTGCTFSAAIAAGLARGLPPIDAIHRAKTYVSRAIETSLALGQGHGPTNHLVGLSSDWTS